MRWVASLLVPLSGRILLAGDFNARHPRWDSLEAPSAGTEAFLDNLPAGLDLLNPVDVPTHDCGGVLDLAWTNIPGSDATVSEYHAVGSDHLPLHISLHCNTPRPGHTLLRTVDQDLGAKMRDFLTLPPLGRLDTAEDVNEAALQLQESVMHAYKAVCTRSVSGAPGVPWWQSSLNETRQLARHTGNWETFRKEVRKAKAEYWARQINEAKGTEIWGIGRWRHKRDPLGAPPLRDGGEIFITGQEKAECFLRRLLAKAARNPAPALEGPSVEPLPSVPLPSLADTKDCLLGSGNTAPGLDRLTTNVLQSVWEAIGTRIRAIYTACLTVGHHPRIWREARVVMVPKPNKDDAADPRNWRPIALLSVLSKGLERYVARWLAYLAVDKGVLSATHFGATPRRATLDLVLSFVSRIEAALREGKHAALLLQDVEGPSTGYRTHGSFLGYDCRAGTLDCSDGLPPGCTSGKLQWQRLQAKPLAHPAVESLRAPHFPQFFSPCTWSPLPGLADAGCMQMTSLPLLLPARSTASTTHSRKGIKKTRSWPPFVELPLPQRRKNASGSPGSVRSHRIGYLGIPAG